VPRPFSTFCRRLHRVSAAGAFALLLFAQPGAADTVSTGIDEDAKLPYWELEAAGMTVRLVQRLPEQSSGFFQARGFSPADAELIARSCVFQTIFKNTSGDPAAGVLQYNLRDWVVNYRGRERAMKTREDWKPVWEQRRVPQEAQIAFEWALLPTRQTYQPGDYNWGMSMFDLKPGAVFDLKVVWMQHGRKQTALIKDVQCALDTTMQPKGE
jgi:hypothetical protein